MTVNGRAKIVFPAHEKLDVCARRRRQDIRMVIISAIMCGQPRFSCIVLSAVNQRVHCSGWLLGYRLIDAHEGVDYVNCFIFVRVRVDKLRKGSWFSIIKGSDEQNFFYCESLHYFCTFLSSLIRENIQNILQIQWP